MSKISIINTKHIAFLTLILFLFNVACKKYEEGPCISFKSKESRLTGRYNVKYYKINDADSTSYFNNEENTGTIYIGSDNESEMGPIIDFYFVNCIISGNWAWRDNKRQIRVSHKLYWSLDTVIGPIGGNNIVIWDILKLTDTELVLETNYNNKKYRLELEE